MPVTGAVIVSTPQNIALADTKGVGMFQLDTVEVPVRDYLIWLTLHQSFLKINLYLWERWCRNLADDLNLPLLAEIPLVKGIRESAIVLQLYYKKMVSLQSFY